MRKPPFPPCLTHLLCNLLSPNRYFHLSHRHPNVLTVMKAYHELDDEHVVFSSHLLRDLLPPHRYFYYTPPYPPPSPPHPLQVF
jgi:hypothetical protein